MPISIEDEWLTHQSFILLRWSNLQFDENLRMMESQISSFWDWEFDASRIWNLMNLEICIFDNFNSSKFQISRVLVIKNSHIGGKVWCIDLTTYTFFTINENGHSQVSPSKIACRISNIELKLTINKNGPFETSWDVSPPIRDANFASCVSIRCWSNSDYRMMSESEWMIKRSPVIR